MPLSTACLNNRCSYCPGCDHECHTDQPSLFDNPEFDPAEGKRRKEEGMAVAKEHAELTWKEAFYEVATTFAASGHPFTSEDVIERVGLPTGDVGLHRNNAVGAMMNALARRGIIVKTGRHVPSKRAVSHGAELTEWIGT